MTETYPEFHVYSDEEWVPIAAELARLGPVSLTDRSTISRLALEYQQFYASAELTSPERTQALACYQEIEFHIRKLFDAIDRLDSLRKTPSRVAAITRAMAMATDPPMRDLEFNTWREQTRAVMLFAIKSNISSLDLDLVKDSNRSLSIALQGFIASMLHFWIERGGHAGKSPGSPAVRFVLAAARPIIPDLKASTVSHFIRSQGTQSSEG
jgi:hypothetical protein